MRGILCSCLATRQVARPRNGLAFLCVWAAAPLHEHERGDTRNACQRQHPWSSAKQKTHRRAGTHQSAPSQLNSKRKHPQEQRRGSTSPQTSLRCGTRKGNRHSKTKKGFRPLPASSSVVQSAVIQTTDTSTAKLKTNQKNRHRSRRLSTSLAIPSHTPPLLPFPLAQQ